MTLVVDTPFLLWRAFYGGARFDPEAAVRNAMKEVARLEESFGTPVYAFDAGPYRRAAVFPAYKQKRQESSGDAEREATKDRLRERMKALAAELRDRFGPRRVLCYAGYEADDHAAAVCAALPSGEEAVVCSRDKDLLQVIRPRVRVYDPVAKELWDHRRFRTEYGIHPTEWPLVKALAGCASDEVPGADGVGEKTAAAFVAGTLNMMHARALACREFQKTPEYKRNVLLCTLPFPGTPPYRFES